MLVVGVNTTWGQHPFTLTTADDVTNGTEILYYIESKGATGFYMIPMGTNDDSGVSTSNMPNDKMLWYFMDAGSNNNVQYYYIVNKSTGKYLRLKGNNGADNSIGIKTYAANDNTYKFSITAGTHQWIIQPYSSTGHTVNKKGSNVNYTNGLKSSTANGTDVNSNWSFVAKNDLTLAHPFTNSTNSEKHYYLIQSANTNTFYMSTDNGYAAVSTDDNNNRMWYFEEAETDATIPSLKFYYIVNAETGNYMYYNGSTTGSETSTNAKGGTVITKPFVFKGKGLRINFATSAYGNIKIVIKDKEGNEASTCELFGDSDNRNVKFENADITDFSGKEITLTFEMKDAKLYAFEFLG